MAHFAKLDDNNIVIAVHCVNNLAVDPENEEESGIEFLTKLHNWTNWKQTSYNGNIRKNFAGIGFFYNEEMDAFISPQPDTNAVLNMETGQWIITDA